MKLNLQTNACDPERLESFLSGDLSDSEERDFTLHLNTCENCRQSLQQQAAEPEAWLEAEKLLKPAEFDAAGAEEVSDSGSLQQSTRQPLQIQNVLAALGPTDDPEMLGRLGGYEVSGVVGAGGMGVVLKAIDKSLDRTVAIKVLAPHLATSGAARKRFAREAKAAAAVLHPNVIAIHSVSNDESLPYLVMPYVRGTSLQKRLDREGPLSLQEILRIGSQIAAGLAAAHAQGLVHRDIKPANILLEDGVERVTITDFGLARAVDDATITHSGVIAGTPQYMSPEQARGEAVDGRSDLFSLGSVLYAICTGRPPFRAETTYGVMRRITDDEPTSIRELNPDIPPWLCSIIVKLMSKQAANRFGSATEVSELLEKCLAHVQQPAAVPLPQSCLSLRERSAPSAERKTTILGRFLSISRRSLGVIAMIAAFGLGLLGMVLWQASEAPDIAGKWTGEEWGEVVLEQNEPGEYEGTYTDTFKQKPGKIQMKWSRLEGRYKGTWQEGKDRHGKISVRLVEGEIHGAWTTSEKSGINPGNPELSELLWKRSSGKERGDEFGEGAKANQKSDKELLQGTWTLSAEYSGGKQRPDDDESIQFPRELFIEGNKYTEHIKYGRRLEGGLFHQTFELDPSQKPKRITRFAPTFTREGIYKLEGDTLTFCWAGGKLVNNEKQRPVQGHVRGWTVKEYTARPGEFRTAPDLPWTLFIYKRDKGKRSEATEQPAKLEGIVLGLKDQEFVEISIGAEDGVRARDTLNVSRDNTYLGKITVTRVATDKSVARVDSRKGEIRVDDRVSSKSVEEVLGTPDSSLKGGELRFSETKEFVLSMGSSKFMLDLDTGKTMDAPAQTGRPEKKLMDLHTDQVQPYHYPKELIGVALEGREVKESDWDASAAEVRRALAGDGIEPLKQMDLGPEKHPTYFFKTRDGAMGVLQLLELVDEPKGIRLRYKTVEMESGRLPEPSSATKPTEAEPIEKVVDKRASLPKSEQEKAVAKLVLVFFQDKSRRAVPCLVLNAGDETIVVSGGPAGIVPDGTELAVDGAFLELLGQPPIPVEFDSRSTKEFSIHRMKDNLHAIQLSDTAQVAVNDSLLGIGIPHIFQRRATVVALDQHAELDLRDRDIKHQYESLIEIDRVFPEGTPLFRDGKLAGLTLLGSRFLGEKAGKSYVVPATRIVELCERIAEPPTKTTARDWIERVQGKTDDAPAYGEKRQDLQLGLQVKGDQRQLHPGDYLKFAYVIRNLGKNRIRFEYEPLHPDGHTPRIRNERGEQKTITGVITTFDRPTYSVSLEPGEVHRISYSVILGKRSKGTLLAEWESPVPGRYTLDGGLSLNVISPDDPDKKVATVLSSGTVGFEVSEKSADKIPPQQVNTVSKQLCQFPVDDSVTSIAYSPDGKLIAIAKPNPDDSGRILYLGGKRLVEILDAGLVAGHSVAPLKLVTAEEDEMLAATKGLPHCEVGPIAFSPVENVIAVGSGIGQVKLFNARTGELVLSLDDEKARLADKEMTEKLKALKRAMGSVRSLVFSPGGTLLATCGQSFEDVPLDTIERGRLAATGPGRLKLWEVKTGTLVHDLVGHSHADAVSFSADGSLLASAGRWSGSDDGTGVIIWNALTGKKVSTILQEANAGTHAVVFSPTSKLVAIGSRQYDKENDSYTTSVSVAYALSGITQWKQTIPGWANPKAFTPDGKTVVVLCGGQSIRFIKTETGELQHEIKCADFLPATPRQGSQWFDFAITPTGPRLAIGGADKERKGSVEIWSLDGLGAAANPGAAKDAEKADR